MTLIPAAVTECHWEKDESPESYFWPKGIILSFFRQVFLWMSREKSDTPTNKKHSKKVMQLIEDVGTNNFCLIHPHFFLPQKRKRKSSRNGFEVDKLSTTFLTLSFSLKIPNSLALRQSDFLNEQNRIPAYSADVVKRAKR